MCKHHLFCKEGECLKMWRDICTSEGDVMFGAELISIFSCVFAGIWQTKKTTTMTDQHNLVCGSELWFSCSNNRGWPVAHYHTGKKKTLVGVSPRLKVAPRPALSAALIRHKPQQRLFFFVYILFEYAAAGEFSSLLSSISPLVFLSQSDKAELARGVRQLTVLHAVKMPHLLSH